MGKTILQIGSRDRQTLEAETIEIFGTAYKTLTVQGKNDLKVGARAKEFAKKYKSLNLADLDIETLTSEQAEEIQQVVKDLTRIILPDLPGSVLEELEDLERLQIIQAYFTSANGKNLLAAAKLENQAPGQEGGKALPAPDPLAEFKKPVPRARPAGATKVRR